MRRRLRTELERAATVPVGRKRGRFRSPTKLFCKAPSPAPFSSATRQNHQTDSMIYQALVLRLDENIEEEVSLQIGGNLLTCFANICPYVINENGTYPVEFHLHFFDSCVIEEVSESETPSILRVENGFAYVITGRLEGEHLKSMEMVFEDETLAQDFKYLSGKMVRLNVDRLEVEFVTRSTCS